MLLYLLYDKLILSPGAYPIVPQIPGLEKVSVFTVRNVADIDKLNQSIPQINHLCVLSH